MINRTCEYALLGNYTINDLIFGVEVGVIIAITVGIIYAAWRFLKWFVKTIMQLNKNLAGTGKELTTINEVLESQGVRLEKQDEEIKKLNTKQELQTEMIQKLIEGMGKT